MTKAQIKKIARIYSAVLVCNALGTGARTDLMTEDEHELFQAEVDIISTQIAKNLPGRIFELALLDDIVKFVTDDNK